ncbi:MAG: AraC family transcriptional regulator [Clostridia bacterium]|jgi:phage FluMu protein Com|nr:AraC family transcriptional regulator [Clostridia bacterium]MDD4571389.1 AraC family transcriptional regulator [Clostridia bacterium]
MSELKEKVAYLQGLAKGMELKESSKEGKLIKELLDVLGDVVDEINELAGEQDELIDYVEEMDDDLAALEDDFYEEDEYDDEEGCCCCDDDDDYCECDDDYVEVTCPQCKEVVCFDKDILDSEDLIEVVCPVCDAVVFVNNGEGVPAGEAEEAEETDKE